MRRPVLALFMAWTALAAAAACSSFSGSSNDGDAAVAPVPTSSTSTSSTSSSSSSSGGDDAAADADADAAPVGASCIGGDRVLGDGVRRLYAAPKNGVYAYPFAIDVNATDVFWIEQFAQANDATRLAAYNGSATTARVRRIAKTANEATASDVVASGALVAQATSLAVAGEWVYWAAPLPEAGSEQRIYRVKASCKTGSPEPCNVATVGTINGARIARMLAPKPEALVLFSENGAVWTIDAKAAPTIHPRTIPFGASTITATSEKIFAAGLNLDKVYIATLDAVSGFAEAYSLPPLADDAGFRGAVFLATDCTSLYALRRGDQLWSFDLATGRPGATHPAPDVDHYTMAVDRTYVYLGAANGGGVWAMDKATGIEKSLISQSAWAVAVDDQGVYFGDHDDKPVAPGETGSIYMLLKE